MPGDDHAGAMTPAMLGELVRRIGRIEMILGSPEKSPLAAEQRAIDALRVKMLEVDFD
jgi:sialic acid synthase SpsE